MESAQLAREQLILSLPAMVRVQMSWQPILLLSTLLHKGLEIELDIWHGNGSKDYA